jgi:hypothetical protein
MPRQSAEALAEGRRKEEGKRRKGKRKRRKGEKGKKKRKEGKRKRKKVLEELEEILGKIRRERERDFCGVFRFFGCWRNFRDDSDGEEGRSTGPRQARDSW